jgi:hypothetical protein
MIRPIFTEIALFATPFVVYALYLLATRAGVFDARGWSLSVLAWLTIISLALMAASFVLIANFSGAPPRSTYVPAHIENGRLVPGTDK